jgi:hypothetical protein
VRLGVIVDEEDFYNGTFSICLILPATGGSHKGGLKPGGIDRSMQWLRAWHLRDKIEVGDIVIKQNLSGGVYVPFLRILAPARMAGRGAPALCLSVGRSGG